MPHKTSQEVIRDLPKTLKIIDLSADFRLRDPDEYEKWYGNPHVALEQQEEAVYGLTEFYRDEIRNARLGGWHGMQRGDWAVCAAAFDLGWCD